MTWIRRQGTRSSGRSSLLLSSVLALLAFACFPIFAQADSGEIQYQPGVTGPDGGASENESIAKKSTDPPNSGGAEAPPSTGSGESYSEEVPPSSESQGTANAGNDDGTGQGNPDKGNNPPAEAKVQPAAPLVKSDGNTSDDDGSSPLVPILIVALVLAAISIAAVMYRQRRQRDGSSPLSTKAG
jgi:hypothetical protein